MAAIDPQKAPTILGDDLVSGKADRTESDRGSWL
jgi:hypothetical protein